MLWFLFIVGLGALTLDAILICVGLALATKWLAVCIRRWWRE